MNKCGETVNNNKSLMQFFTKHLTGMVSGLCVCAYTCLHNHMCIHGQHVCIHGITCTDVSICIQQGTSWIPVFLMSVPICDIILDVLLPMYVDSINH